MKCWGIVVALVLVGCGGAEGGATHGAGGGAALPAELGAGGEALAAPAAGGATAAVQSAAAGSGGAPDAHGAGGSSGGATAVQVSAGGQETGGAAPVTGAGGVAESQPGTGGAMARGDAGSPCPVFYRDADGDGFGAPGTATNACPRPDGYVANDGDCMDNNAAVHPGAPGAATDRGDGSFDYDCDGIETPEVTKFASCPTIDNACPPPNTWTGGFTCDYIGMTATGVSDGWSPCWTVYNCDAAGNCGCNPAGKIPSCGKSGTFGVAMSWNKTAGYSCSMTGPSATLHRQTCR